MADIEYFESVARTDANGTMQTFYQVKQQYTVTSAGNPYPVPYIRLYGASAQNISVWNAILNTINSSASSLLRNFLRLQGVTQPEPTDGDGNRDHEAYGKAYIRIDYESNPQNFGAQFVAGGSDTIPGSGDVAYVLLDRDWAKGDGSFNVGDADGRIRMNRYMALQGVAPDVPGGDQVVGSGSSMIVYRLAHRLDAAWYKQYKGVRDYEAWEQLNGIHELFHIALHEGVGATGSGMRGHATVYNRLLGLGDTHAATLIENDIKLDPVEKAVFLEGKAKGLITNESRYWRDRLKAYQQGMAALGITDIEDLKKSIAQGKFDKDTAIASVVVEPDFVSLHFASEVLFGALRFDASDLLGVFGATIGRMLAGDNVLGGLIASSALEVTLTAFGDWLEQQVPAAGATSTLRGTLGEEFLADLQASGIGAISSYLTAEAIDGLDLDPLAADFANTVGGATLNTIVNNILHLGEPILSGGQVVGYVEWNTGLNGAFFVNIVGSWVGTKLAMEVGDFDTQGGQIGAAIGSAYGSINAGIILAQYPGLWSYPIIAFIVVVVVVFLDTLLGGAIGTWINGTPKSGANIVWDEGGEKFAVGSVSSKNGIPSDGARSIAENIVSGLNGIVDLLGAKISHAEELDIGKFGQEKDHFVHWDAHPKNSFGKVQRLIEYGILNGLAAVSPKLVGGDSFLKRALLASLANGGVAGNGDRAWTEGYGLNTLMSDFAVARDYSAYLANPTAVDAIIAENPHSSFAAGWLITFARAVELGLDKRAVSDWAGGFNAFLDQVAGGLDGVAFAPSVLAMYLDEETGERRFKFVNRFGEDIGELGDTIDTAAMDRVFGTAGADTIQFSGNTLSSTTGLTINGAVSAGAALTPSISASIDGGAGNDLLLAGDLGMDLLGGEGADRLIGGKLDDWLLGGSGDDILFAGNVANTSFVAGDAAAEAAALAANGGNGDYLEGGEGNDRLYGGTGSDWLSGGAGVDRIRGGAGGDIIAGGAGDDGEVSGQASLQGGGGSDQYIFGYGDGQDVILDDDGSGAADIHARITQITAGTLERDWAGDGDYELDGTVRGGDDAVAFGVGVTMGDIVLSRTGTNGADLRIVLTKDNEQGVPVATGDVLVIKNWFNSSNRVEWFRFADGDEMRITDIATFTIGTGASDVIIGTVGGDFLYGGGGDDTLRGLQGGDFASGGLGDDFVAGDEDNDYVIGGGGNDQVLGGDGHDTVTGDDGDDVIFGGAGSDIMSGGRGNDTAIGGLGDDLYLFRKGDGHDTITSNYADQWDIVYENGQYVNGYSQVDGKVIKDGLVYFDGRSWIGGYDWNSTTGTMRRQTGGMVTGQAGVDTLEFGVGINVQDILFEMSGSDLMISIVGENASGSFRTASDTIRFTNFYSTANSSLRNIVLAGTGVHAIWGLDSTTPNARRINSGSSGDNTMSIIDYGWATAGDGDDKITASSHGIVQAGSGNDEIYLNGSSNIVYAGSGDDLITVNGAGSGTTIFGGDGIDILATGGWFYLTNPTSNNSVSASLNINSIEGLSGGITSRLGGTSGDDILINGAVAMGGLGDDTYRFTGGNQTIRDGALTVETIVGSVASPDMAPVINSGQYTVAWTALGRGTVSGYSGQWYRYTLTITRNQTGEVVYQSRDGGLDFRFAAAQTAIPPSATWPKDLGQWKAGAVVGANGQVNYEKIGSGDGGQDVLEISGGLSLSDLTPSRSGSDFIFSISSGRSITLANQANTDHAIERIVLDDGLEFTTAQIRTPGEAGSAAADVMFGDAQANGLRGLAGDDILSGGAGGDVLQGAAGDDVLEGGAGGDVLDGGDDSQTAGAAMVAGAPYGDIVRYLASSAGVSVDLEAGTASGGHATGDTIRFFAGKSTIEHVIGSIGFGDTLAGDGRVNRLNGLGGNDVLFGRAGDDVLTGGAGADQLSGDDGADLLHGEDGDDVAHGGSGADEVRGGAGSDQIHGDDGDDVLNGNAGNDTLLGGLGKDSVRGGDGQDQLSGDDGDDVLLGEEGADILSGGAGIDVLSGGAGSDILQGGLGDDSYVFDDASGADTISDTDGVNTVAFNLTDPSRLWLVKAGNDLIISVIGGSTTVTLAGFFAVNSATRVNEIIVGGLSLFPQTAMPLIEAMTSASAGAPSAAPAYILEMVGAYWHANSSAAPIVADQVVATPVGTALTGQVAAVDHDQDITAYAVVTGPSHGALSLNGATGAWTYAPTAGYGGIDSVVLKVTDALGNVVQQTVRITVGQAPAGPAVSQSLAMISEGVMAGTTVATLTSSQSGSAIYSIVDDPWGLFTLSGNKLQLKGGVDLDFEALTNRTPGAFWSMSDSDGDGLVEIAYTLRVRTNVGEAYSAPSSVITLRIEDNYEAPAWFSKPKVQQSSLILPEGVTTGQLIATLTATQTGSPVAFEIVNDPRGWFTIVGNELRMKAGLTLDYETIYAGLDQAGKWTVDSTDTDVYEEIPYGVQVRSVINGVPSQSSDTIWVRLEDVEELADIVPGQSFSVTEPNDGPKSSNFFIGFMAFTELDFGGPNFRTSDSRVDVGQDGGVWISTHDIDYEKETSLQVYVWDRDNPAGQASAQLITINVLDAPDPVPVRPPFQDEVRLFSEGAVGGGLVATMVDDRGPGATYTIINDPRNWFVVVGNEIRFRSNLSLNYETLADDADAHNNDAIHRVDRGNDNRYEVVYGISVAATYNGVSTPAQSVAVYIGDVYEGSVNKPAVNVVNRIVSEHDSSPLLFATLQDNRSGSSTYSSLWRPQYNFSGGLYVSGDALYWRYDLDFEHLLADVPASSYKKVEDSDGDGQLEVSFITSLHSYQNGTRSAESDLFWFSVEDINEAAVLGGPYSFAVSEDAAAQTLVGAVSATDSDSQAYNRDHRFSLSDTSTFSIDPLTGQIRLNGALDFELQDTYLLTVTVTDRGGAGIAVSQALSIYVLNAAENTPPTVVQHVTGYTEAGMVANATIASLTATQPGGGATFTVVGDTWNLFEISGNQLKLRAGADFNFELLAAKPAAANWVLEDSDSDGQMEVAYTVRTRSTVNGVTSLDSDAITFRVEDVNEAPALAAQPLSAPENAGANYLVGTISSTDPDTQANNRQPRYRIVPGGDGAAFTINPTTGELTLNASANFEIKPNYTVTIGVRDRAGTGLETTRVYTVSVNNLSEAPTVTGGPFSIAENLVAGAAVGTVTGVDPDGGAVSYSLVGENASAFAINPTTGAISVNSAINFEVKPSYGLTVRVTDPSGQFTDHSVTVGVTNVNEAPIVTGGPFNVVENAAVGTVVGTATGVNPEGGAVTYSLVGADASAFAINASGVITVNTAINFETKTSYSLTVRVTDASGQSTDHSIPIGVTDLNEAPAVTGGPFTVVENSAVGTTVGTVTGLNPEGGGVTYSLVGANASAFTINPTSGVITVNSAINFETKTSYGLTVRVTDASGQSADHPVTVDVTDVNEAPTVTGGPFSVAENATIGAIVGTATGLNPEGGSVTYSLVGDNASAFAINSTTGVITVNSAINFETKPNYGLTVRVTDASNQTTDHTVTVTVSDVNEAPTVTGGPFSVSENATIGTVIGTATGVNPEGGGVTYSLVGGDASAFSINASSGVITANSAINFETKSGYTLTVRVTDASGQYTDHSVPVTVTDINEAPIVTGGPFSVAENATIGSVVGTASGVNPEGGAVAYSLVGGDASAFSINATTGVITVNSAINFETKNSYSLGVRVTDASGQATDHLVPVSVIDVNEAPTVAGGPFSVVENAAIGAAVGTVVGANPEGGVVTYSLVGAEAAAFAINATTGAITVNSAVSFETRPNYGLTVRVTDASGQATDHTVTVNVTDVNEAPTIAGGTFNLADTAYGGAVVGTIVSTDPDAIAAFKDPRYSISGAQSAGFSIDAVTGVITADGTVDFQPSTSLSFTVIVTDQGGAGLSAANTVTVNMVAPPPGPTVTITGSGIRNETISSVLSSIGAVATAQPGGTFSIASDPEGWFSVSGIQLRLNAGLNLNFETLLDKTGANWSLSDADGDGLMEIAYTANIYTSVGGVASASTAFTYRIEDVNETPVMQAEAAPLLAENMAIGSWICKFDVNDPDRLIGSRDHRFSLSGTDAAAFTINATTGELFLAVVPDQETKASYTFTVTVIDRGGAGLSNSRNYTFNVTNLNEAPILSAQAFSLAETAATNAVVGTVVSSDPDTSFAFRNPRYTITGGDAGFAINYTTGQITLSSTVDYETQESYSLIVRVTDMSGVGLWTENTITVNIGDLNDAPTLAAQSFATTENGAIGAVIGTVAFADPDSQSANRDHRFTLSGTDAAYFLIDSLTGVLTVNTALDFETRTTYSVTVKVQDQAGSGLFASSAVTINVTDIAEPGPTSAPTFSMVSGLQSETATSTQTTVANLTTTQTGGTAVLAIASDPLGWFEIVGSALKLKAGLNLDFETLAAAAGQGTTWTLADSDADGLMEITYQVTVRSSVGGTNSIASDPITYRIEDQNESPTVSVGSFSLVENAAAGTVLGSILWSDPDTQSALRDPRFALSGTDAALFAIDIVTGQLTVAGTLNYEAKSVYSVTVTATDRGGAGLSASNTVTVTVADANDAPVIAAQTFSVNEKAASNTVVGTVVWSDPDALSANRNPQFTLAGPDSPLFNINVNTGVITAKAGLDYETQAVHNLTVIVTDQGGAGLATSQTVTVNLNDVNDAPTLPSQSFSIAENSATGAIVGTATVADQDALTANRDFRYSLTGTDAAAFAIDIMTGQLTLQTAVNYEAKSSYSVNLVVTDQGGAGLTATRAVTVNVADVNEPISVAAQTFSVDENSAASTVVGTVLWTDIDTASGNRNPRFSLSGADASAFRINATTGVITVFTAPNYEVKSTYTFTVTVKDKGGTGFTASDTITINVNDLTEGQGMPLEGGKMLASTAATPTTNSQPLVVDASPAHRNPVGMRLKGAMETVLQRARDWVGPPRPIPDELVEPLALSRLSLALASGVAPPAAESQSVAGPEDESLAVVLDADVVLAADAAAPPTPVNTGPAIGNGASTTTATSTAPTATSTSTGPQIDLGDARPGAVDRTARPDSPAQAIRQAMGGSAAGGDIQGGYEPMQGSWANAAVQAMRVRAPEWSPTATAAGDDATPDIDFDVAAAGEARTALDQRLDFQQRNRIKMVDAMAGFAPTAAASLDGGNEKLHDPRAMALLTSLPQHRTGVGL